MADTDNSTQDNSGSQRKIFIIFFLISLLITTVVGVLIFRYFNRQSLFDFSFSNNQTKQETPVATVETGEPEEASTDTAPETTPAIKTDEEFAGFGGNGGAPVPTPTPSPVVTPSSKPTISPTPTQAQGMFDLRNWKANDYKFGDIKGDTHLVIIGDTLWEISEGKYGEGRVWKKIADANSVRYLWNGNPLIVPGTTLSLPK